MGLLKGFRNLGVIGAGLICILGSFPLLALERSNTELGINFNIRQEVFEEGQVFVCRPHSTDEKILNVVGNNNIGTLGDYARWLKANIKYKKDGKGDRWMAPEETLREQYGDCEDYAFLNAAVLSVMGYEPEVLALMRFDGIHAICVFKKNGCYWWMDNAELKRSQAQSFSEFARCIFNEYRSFCLLTLNFENKNWNILLKKSEVVKM